LAAGVDTIIEPFHSPECVSTDGAPVRELGPSGG
jgi:hypothetical protein